MAQKGAIIKEIVVAKSINFLKSFIKLKIMIIGKSMKLISKQNSTYHYPHLSNSLKLMTYFLSIRQ